MNQLLILIFVFCGAIVMLFSIIEARNIFKYLNNNNYQKYWNILRYLMIFFLFGYLITFVLFIFKKYAILLLLMGAIFFFGALFVFLVVKISLLTMKDLTQSIFSRLESEKEKETVKAINREKSLFLATMSHEIRTPMNAILGMTNLLLLDTQISDKQKELLEIVKTSSDSLLVIINDILDFSRLESGKITIQKTFFNLRNCIESIIDLVNIQVEKKQLVLCFQIDKNIPDLISTDENRLRQILLNLINNAIKFTEEGYIILRISQQSNKKILFTIQDTGIGISTESLSRLFKPFSQIDFSAKRKFEGTGLGLAISHKLVEILGGNIWVESELKKGTTFSFTIKVKTSFSSKNLQDKTVKFKGKKILVIFPTNDCFYDFITQQLLDWEMNVVSSHSSKQALNNLTVTKAKYDTILISEYIYRKSSSLIQQQLQTFARSINIYFILVAKNQTKANDWIDIFPEQLVSPIKQKNLIHLLARSLNFDRRDEQYLAPKSKSQPDSNREILSSQFPLNILIAEDNRFNQKLAKLIFLKLGYSIDVANNGIGVLEKIKDKNYDLIFMDIAMPLMDGFETTDLILQQKNFVQKPTIVAMTANAMEEDKNKCFRIGMKDFIAKPIKLEEIERVIRRWA